MDNSLFFFFYNLAHQSVFFDKLIIFTAVYLPYLVIILAGFFLIFYRKSWREFFVVFFSGGLAVFFDMILKYLIQAPRPFVAFTDVRALFPETGYAFPSGHATFFGALAVAIYFVDKKAGYVFMLFALLIGLARIIAGVHFPFDILGGFMLGSGISCLFAYFKKNI